MPTPGGKRFALRLCTSMGQKGLQAFVGVGTGTRTCTVARAGHAFARMHILRTRAPQPWRIHASLTPQPCCMIQGMTNASV
eukprot:3947599-Alexandrium_andersonii.AAC.1